MADVTLKAPPEVLDEFAGITGLFPLTPSQPADPRLGPMSPPTGDFGAPLSPNWNPSTPSTLGTNAPDVGTSALPPIQPASDMAPPAGPPGSVDYAQRKYAADVAKREPGVLGKIGGWATSILTPNVAAMIPSTPLGRIVEQRRDLGNLQQAETEQRAEQTAQSEEALRGAQTQETQARTAAMQNPPVKEDWKQVPGTNWAIETGSGRTQQMQGVPAPEDKPDKQNPTQELQRQLIDAENKGDTKTADRLRQQIEDLNPGAEATRAATAEDRATRLQRQKEEDETKATDARQKFTQPFQQAIDTATDAKSYLDGGKYTGPADYALMNEFQEMIVSGQRAGIRFTQNEQDMLRNAQSWYDSLAAKTRHALSGSYFSDEQRKQMVDVMQGIAKRAQKQIDDYATRGGKQGSAGAGGKQGGEQPVYVNGKLTGYTTDGKTYSRMAQ